jgi:hypothetical protein
MGTDIPTPETIIYDPFELEALYFDLEAECNCRDWLMDFVVRGPVGPSRVTPEDLAWVIKRVAAS